MAISSQDQFDLTILNLVNQERASYNQTQGLQGESRLNPLVLSEKLDAAADLHSRQMAQQDFVEHDNPVTGSTIRTRIEGQGYTIAENRWGIAENIAAGYETPEVVMNAWMNSSGHRANILNPNYTHFGVGHYYLKNDTGTSNFNRYWTQTFGFGGRPGDYEAETNSPPPPPNPAVIEGTSAGDVLNGTGANETLRGLAGDDTIKGANGNDKLDGGRGKDKLLGGAGNDKLFGFESNDTLKGGDGNDILVGVNPNASNTLIGRGEKDLLIGNSGADRFVLGRNGKVFYDDGKAANSGTRDYGLIRGLSVTQGDRIQLEGRASDYVLGQSGTGLPRGTKIYAKTDGVNELIGIIQNVTITSTNSNVFRYV